MHFAVITYQVESWFNVLPELEAHWQAHYEEVAPDKNKIALAPDYEQYAHLDDTGSLHVLTARYKGEVIGYVVAVVRPHLHYRHNLFAFFDLYYIAPEYRRGWAGVRLFQEAERTLKARGVQKMFAGTKLWKNASCIFKFLHWTQPEYLFSKWIGE